MSTATMPASFRQPRARASRPAPRTSRVGRPAAERRAGLEQRQLAEHGPVRLTRRGRIVVLMTVLAIALAGFALVGSPAVSTGETHHAAQHTVVVRGGETLWDIASRIAPGEDPRVVIGDIVDLNNLPDAGSVRIGEKLFVPTY